MTYIFTKRDLRILIIGALAGGILQVLCRQYLKNHPELLDDKPVNGNEPLILVVPPGGNIIKRFFYRRVFEIIIEYGKRYPLYLARKGVMQYIAEYGLKTSIYGCFTLIGLLKIPSKALREALPQNQLDKSKLILVDQQKVCLDQLDVCDIDDLGFRYLLEMLTDPDIPYTEKEQKVGKRLAKFFGFKRPNQLNVRIIICFTFLLYLLYFQNKSAFYIMMKHLIKAIQEGRISKRIARLIARRLKAKGVPIDPELLEIISSDND